jgi:hypothetical protein
MNFRWILPLLILSACAARHPSEVVARGFLDSYYVATDLHAAEQFTDGLAHEKVLASLQLTSGQVINGSTKRPTVSYKLHSKSIDETEAEYIFFVRIKPADFDVLFQKTRLIVRLRDGEWRVTQFSDHEGDSREHP